MYNRMSEKKQRKSGYGQKAVLLLLCLLCCFLISCKKDGEQPEEGQGTPTTEIVLKSFAEANPELVEKRAKELEDIVAVTVGDTDVSMTKAMFLIYSMETQGNNYAAYYASEYGTDYWNMEYDEGRTTRDIFKEETINTVIKYAVLYDCAVKYGMTLTYDEEKKNIEFVEALKEAIIAEEAERGGFTTDNLRETCAWMMLAEKYYGMMTDTLGITRESVEKQFKRKDYKEYETEYLYLPTTYYDEEYNICNESDDVIAARKAQIQKCYERVAEGATFEELAAEDELLVYNVRTFLENGEEAEAKYKEVAMELVVGEVSEPLQTEYGVYLIKMLDDECTKTYEATVDAEYEVQRDKAFQAAYEVLLATYDIKVNEEAWSDITMGATVSLLE